MRSTRLLLASLLLAGFSGTLSLHGQQPITGPDVQSNGVPSDGSQTPAFPSNAGQISGVPSNSSSDPQAISKTGLLPVYGVALRLDPTWVDGSQFPSPSANVPGSGAGGALQQVWGTLQPAGFSVLRVGIDIRDSGTAANQAANLCVWAKSNNLRLILMLTGSDDGQPLSPDYGKQAAAFVKSLGTLLRGNNNQFLTAYAQIAAYQLEDGLNHAGHHGQMTASAAQQALLSAAQQLRQAEKQALDGSGLDATPLLVNASFDFELIRARMIAGTTLNDDAYSSAYKALTQFLSPLAASSDIDLLAVDWLPGSLSAGSVDKFPRLLRDLLGDLPGKQLLLTTGFSTAFHERDDQKRFYGLAFATLGDFRASVGVDCPFVGLLFREGVNGKDQNPDPARPSLPTEMASWDLLAKADDLTKMWTTGKHSDDMAWWLKKTENNLGLTATPGSGSGTITASPAQQTLTQIAAAVGQASVAQPGPSPSADSVSSTFPGNPAATPFTPQPGANPSIDSTNAAPGGIAATAGNFANPSVAGATTPFGSAQSPDAAGGQGSGLGKTLEATAQQGLMGLLDAVFKRVGNQISGVPGSGFSSSNGNFSSPNTSAFSGAAGQGFSSPSGTLSSPNTGISASLPPAGSTFSSPNAGGSPADASGSGITSSPTSASTSGLAGSTSTDGGAQPGATPANTGGNNSSSFAGNAAAGSGQPVIQLVAQNASFQPTNPQVQDAITLAVSVANQGQSDALGVQVSAVNEDGASLAQSESVRIAPGSRVTAKLSQFVPTEARTFHITFQVVDGFGNQQASLPLDVSVSPRPQSIGSNLGTSGTNPGSGTVGVPRAPTNGGSSIPGGLRSTPSSTVGNVATPPVVSAPPGVVSFSGVHVGSFGQPVVPGKPTPVSVSLSNRFLVPLNNVQATMVVDGKELQTLGLPVLLPGQTRSVLFPAVTMSQPGRHEMNILLHSQRPGQRVQLSVVTSQVVVPNAPAPQAAGGGSVRSILTGHSATAQPGAQTAGTGVRGFFVGAPATTPGPGGVRSILMPVSRPGSVPAATGQPPAHTQSAILSDKTPAPLATPRASLPPTLPPVPPTPVHSDLVINVEDIRSEPSRPVVGRRVLFGARVLNRGDGVARRAALVFRLVSDGKQVAGSRLLQFDLEPKSARQETFEAVMPAGRQVQLLVFVSENENGKVITRQAAIEVRPAPARPGATGRRAGVR